MIGIDGSLLDFKQLDLLAMRQTAIHRLDPRAKLITTLLFIVCVVSFNRYEISAMLPFLLFPAVLLGVGELPLGYILRKIMIVIPFALVIGIFNPLFDRQVLMQLGPIDVWGGWISCFSILLRALLTASAAIILVAITGFPNICAALEKLGMPQIFAVQLLFLYRYIFVLTDEAVRTARARQLRSFGKRGMGMRQFGSLAGNLLLRTWERADRVYMAMLARGFDGKVQTRQQGRFGLNELAFVLGWGALFLLFRCYNLPQQFGALITGVLS
ncbi:MAG: cobalt ECF transporter T component CbiQ [Desulfuromonadales bacterium]|nr:cobalt ECF transporter T component CbiQ [Desulfuromonadales bacterium]